MKSVLQDWVMELPLREQGTLLTGVRGCDDAPKRPFDNSARQLTAFLRYSFMNPADPREVGLAGAFFQSATPEYKASDLGNYPQHWYAHIMHAYEVVAYRCPHNDVADVAHGVYMDLVRNMHLNPETKSQMASRLSEDRIASGTVVS